MADFVKNAKFWVVYPMAAYLRNTEKSVLTELPPLPCASYFPGKTFGSSSEMSQGEALLYTGGMKRMLKNRLHAQTVKNLRLVLGILQGVKRGAEVVPESFIHDAMIKHRTALTKEVKVEKLGYFEPYFVRFFKDLPQQQPKLFEASTSAAWGVTRSQGGAREFIRATTLFGQLKTDRRGATVFPSQIVPSELLEMYEERPGVVREVRGSPSTPDIRDVRAEIRRRPEVPVMVQAVLEPLKVRLITKGEPFRYYFSRFFQKELWGYMKRFPQFDLTHHPVTIQDLHSLLDRERALKLDFPLWVSGDYSAATDNLKLAYTKLAFEKALCQSGLAEEDKNSLRDVLYEQELHYPPTMNKSGELDPTLQRTGQLMGSTLSFPILCAVNLVCYWMTLESFLGHSVSARSLPVLVNGDDILFRCNEEFYRMWLKNIHEVGFELSLGKNYVSKRFLTVNSTGFLWDGVTFHGCGYLNVGLLTGQSKLSGRSETQVSPIWSYYNEVIRGAVDPVRAHERFLHYNREVIDDLTQSGNYSLFLDPLYGGLGFHLDPRLETSVRQTSEGPRPMVRFTPFQRRFGHFLRRAAKQPFEGEFEKFRPFRGIVVPSSTKMPVRHLYHFGHFKTRAMWGPADSSGRLYTPLGEGETLAMDSDRPVQSALMSFSIHSRDPEMIVSVRPPDRSTLRAFRASMEPYRGIHKLLCANLSWVETRSPPN
jgi:hypothetical protein